MHAATDDTVRWCSLLQPLHQVHRVGVVELPEVRHLLFVDRLVLAHKDNNEADKCNMSYKIDSCPVEELQGILILSNENDLGVE